MHGSRTRLVRLSLSGSYRSELLCPIWIRPRGLLNSLFGIGPFRSVVWPNRPESKYQYRGVEQHILLNQAFVQLGQVEIELIQPLEGERNAYKEFLDQTGGGIHHVLFEVKDIDSVLQALAESGVSVLQSGTGIRPGTRWALLDTQEHAWISRGVASSSRRLRWCLGILIRAL